MFDRRPSRPSVAVFVVDDGENLARDDIGRRPPAALFRDDDDDDDDVEPPPDEEAAMTEQSPILRAIVALTMRLRARCLFIIICLYGILMLYLKFCRGGVRLARYLYWHVQSTNRWDVNESWTAGLTFLSSFIICVDKEHVVTPAQRVTRSEPILFCCCGVVSSWI